jgi:hypothetical protein
VDEASAVVVMARAAEGEHKPMLSDRPNGERIQGGAEARGQHQ